MIIRGFAGRYDGIMYLFAMDLGWRGLRQGFVKGGEITDFAINLLWKDLATNEL